MQGLAMGRALGPIARNYRDLAALLYLAIIYPWLVADGRLSSETGNTLQLAMLALGAVGIIANLLKLWSLDATIHEKGQQRLVDSTAMRFLAGFVALPLIAVLPLGLSDPPLLSESWLGPLFLGAGIVAAAGTFTLGRGKHSRPAPAAGRHAANVGLVIYENFIYTFFLEMLFLAEPGGPDLRGLLVLPLPLTGLFLLVFLPCTLGFYIEDLTESKSKGLTIVRLWGRFLAFRYVPAFVPTYLWETFAA